MVKLDRYLVKCCSSRNIWGVSCCFSLVREYCLYIYISQYLVLLELYNYGVKLLEIVLMIALGFYRPSHPSLIKLLSSQIFKILNVSCFFTNEIIDLESIIPHFLIWTNFLKSQSLYKPTDTFPIILKFLEGHICLWLHVHVHSSLFRGFFYS